MRFMRTVVNPVLLGISIVLLLLTLVAGNGVLPRMLGDRSGARISFSVEHRKYGAALDGDTLVVEPGVLGWDLAFRIEDERGSPKRKYPPTAWLDVLVGWSMYPDQRGPGLFWTWQMHRSGRAIWGDFMGLSRLHPGAVDEVYAAIEREDPKFWAEYGVHLAAQALEFEFKWDGSPYWQPMGSALARVDFYEIIPFGVGLDVGVWLALVVVGCNCALFVRWLRGPRGGSGWIAYAVVGVVIVAACAFFTVGVR